MADEEEDQEFVEKSPKGNYGKYKRMIGKGAFKKVFKAQDLEHGNLLAWNEVNIAGYHHKERKRILNEVALLKRLVHTNLIKFFGAWINKEKEQIIFVTELMSSGTLKEFRSKYPLSRRQIKEYCKEILDCLEYLHGQGIIHRDLKCENIFVQGKSIKIGDLGLATMDGRSVIGTPEFMAPDMYDNNYDASVDIWAFGMCVLEMVTGFAPYHECRSVPQILRKVSRGEKPEALGIVEIEWPECAKFIKLCLGEMITSDEANNTEIDAASVQISRPEQIHVEDNGSTTTEEADLTPDNKAKRINIDSSDEFEQQFTYRRPPAKVLKEHPFLIVEESDKQITTNRMINEQKKKLEELGYYIPCQGRPPPRGATPPVIARAYAGQEQQQGEAESVQRRSPPRKAGEGTQTQAESTEDEATREANGEPAHVSTGPRIEGHQNAENFTEYIQPPVAPQVTEEAAHEVPTTSDRAVVSDKHGNTNAVRGENERVHPKEVAEAGMDEQTDVTRGTGAHDDNQSTIAANDGTTGYGSATVELTDTTSSVRLTDEHEGSTSGVNAGDRESCYAQQEVNPDLSEPRPSHFERVVSDEPSSLSMQRVQSEEIGYSQCGDRVKPSGRLSISKSTLVETVPTPSPEANAPKRTSQQQVQPTNPRSLGDEVRLLKGSVSELREMMTFVLKNTEGGQSFLKDLEQRRKNSANRLRPVSAQNSEQRSSEASSWKQHDQVGNSQPRGEFDSGVSSSGNAASTVGSQYFSQLSTLGDQNSGITTEGSHAVPTQNMNIENYPFLNTEAKTIKMQEDDFKRLAQCLHNAAVQELNSYYGNKPLVQLPAEFYREIQRIRNHVENQIGSEYRIASRRKADLAKEVESMEQRHREEVAKELRTHEKEKEKFNKSREMIMRKKEVLRQDKNYRHSPTTEVDPDNKSQYESEASICDSGAQHTSNGPSIAAVTHDQKQPTNKETRESKEAREKQERKEKTREEAHRREKRLLEQRVKEEDERHAEENRKREEDRRRQLKHFAERARRIEEKRSQKVSAFLADAETNIRQIVDKYVNSSSNSGSTSTAETITSESQQGTMEHAHRLKVATGLSECAETNNTLEVDPSSSPHECNEG